MHKPETVKRSPSTTGAGKTTAASRSSIATDRDEVDELLDELNRLVGLSEVKREVKSLVNSVRTRKRREEHGYPSAPIALHRVFIGGPGTGKTHVARLMGRIFRSLGTLSNGHIVEVNRYNLVAGSVGGTISMVRKAVQEARGGILFIDKADILGVEY